MTIPSQGLDNLTTILKGFKDLPLLILITLDHKAHRHPTLAPLDPKFLPLLTPVVLTLKVHLHHTPVVLVLRVRLLATQVVHRKDRPLITKVAQDKQDLHQIIQAAELPKDLLVRTQVRKDLTPVVLQLLVDLKGTHQVDLVVQVSQVVPPAADQVASEHKATPVFHRNNRTESIYLLEIENLMAIFFK